MEISLDELQAIHDALLKVGNGKEINLAFRIREFYMKNNLVIDIPLYKLEVKK